VDAFSYGKIDNCDGYFLTHFHTDHYGGLKSNWAHGPIYCSQITANLVRRQLGVEERYIHPLPMDTLVSVTDTIQVGLIDANHCPGSVLFLFVIKKDDKTIRHLHTGDFRASPRICLHPLLCQPDNPPLNHVYLDTTYMDPKYAFPAQEECIEAVCDLIKREVTSKTSFLDKWTSVKRAKTINQRVLIVVGAYKIGKERVFYSKGATHLIYAIISSLILFRCG
jgi:DNA cross-link repair 1A protein